MLVLNLESNPATGYGWQVRALNPGILRKTGPGAVYGAALPYTTTDAPCNGSYTHHETIADWVYIGNDSSVPSTEAKRQAILDHGPVSAAVCVNSSYVPGCNLSFRSRT